MPVLPSNLIESTEEAAQSSGDFKALDTGVYTGRLSKCEASSSRDGKPMWRLEFDQILNLDGTRAMGGRLFSNLTLEESTAWKVAQFFAAFDVPTSTDTDVLVNSRIRLQVVKKVQDFPGSKNFGKDVNDIDRYVSLAEGDDGYEKAQQLKARLSGKKAAPAKKAAAPAVERDVAVSDESDDSDLDF